MTQPMRVKQTRLSFSHDSLFRIRCSTGNYRLGQLRYVYRDKLLRMHRRLSRAVTAFASASAVNSDHHNPATATATTTTTTSVAHALSTDKAAKLTVDLAHVGEYDAALLGFLLHQPARILPALELAALDALNTLLYDMRQPQRGAGRGRAGTGMSLDDPYSPQPSQDAWTDADGRDNDPNPARLSQDILPQGLSIQILLTGNLHPTPLRSIQTAHLNRLLNCPGIVISTSPIKNRAVRLKLRCVTCGEEQVLPVSTGPFQSIPLPPYCGVAATAAANNRRNNHDHAAAPAAAAQDKGCKKYPFVIVPDESLFVDQQTLKLQEAPERVPTGEMPRSVLMAVERSLVDVAPPGTRVSVLCIPTLFSNGGGSSSSSSGGGGKAKGDGTKSVYLRVVGMVKDNDAHGPAMTFTPAEEEAFQALARSPSVYDILYRSIAPNISGSYTVDIKKALTCQLFSGSRKRLPDGVRLRGDINVLLLGDPSMAKSQFLKFMSKVAPVGIYTSGKGSSAAGLTASVVRDAKGEFYLEGGAMVLADGGIVCIDEFDKMRAADRVAIHEAMEQQTISVAKAGITTVLNSRSSVLAAANPVYGRYDDLKSTSENIDLMTTILSRFDLIFLVRDVREEERDRMICQHVMGVHIASSRQADGGLGHTTTARPLAANGTSNGGRGNHADGHGGGALSYMASTMGQDMDLMGQEENNRYVPRDVKRVV